MFVYVFYLSQSCVYFEHQVVFVCLNEKLVLFFCGTRQKECLEQPHSRPLMSNINIWSPHPPEPTWSYFYWYLRYKTHIFDRHNLFVILLATQLITTARSPSTVNFTIFKYTYVFC